MSESGCESHEELIAEGTRMVYALSAEIWRKIPFRVDKDDLIAYGQIGLHEAARDFNPDRGVKFTSFAYHRIRGAIFDGIGKMSWTSRARYRRNRRFQQLASEVVAEENRSNVPPTAEESAKWLGRVSQSLGVVYLASQGDDESDNALSRAEAAGHGAHAIVANREIVQKLEELMKQLPNEQARLIRSIYFEGATLQKAADQMGISKSWASRQHAKILEDLGRKLKKMDAGD